MNVFKTVIIKMSDNSNSDNSNDQINEITLLQEKITLLNLKIDVLTQKHEELNININKLIQVLLPCPELMLKHFEKVNENINSLKK